jgi:glycosyltransferase involved in cell wall biosynthesis
VFVADGVKNALPYRFSKAAVTTIQNGVNCADIVRRAGSGARMPSEKLVLCSAGRLEHQKGYDLLIEACKLLPATVRGSMRLLIAGSGSKEAALRRQIDEAGLDGVVVLLGYQDNPYPLIKGADICVFSSRYEGFSIAAAEAMTLGCPVITTRVTGIPELLTHGVNAVVADEISPPSLRDAMLMLIEDAGLRASIGSRGRTLAHERFDIATTSNQYLALYGSE